jgi:hypothetical protein
MQLKNLSNFLSIIFQASSAMIGANPMVGVEETLNYK